MFDQITFSQNIMGGRACIRGLPLARGEMMAAGTHV